MKYSELRTRESSDIHEADTACCFATGNPCSEQGSKHDESNGHDGCEGCKNKTKTFLIPFRLPTSVQEWECQRTLSEGTDLRDTDHH